MLVDTVIVVSRRAAPMVENGTPLGGAEEWRKIRNGVRARTMETEAAER